MISPWLLKRCTKHVVGKLTACTEYIHWLVSSYLTHDAELLLARSSEGGHAREKWSMRTRQASETLSKLEYKRRKQLRNLAVYYRVKAGRHCQTR